MKRVAAILGLALFAVAVGLALFNAVRNSRADSGNGGKDSLTVVGAVSGTPVAKAEPAAQPIPTQPGWETVANVPLYPAAEGMHELIEPSSTIRYVGYVVSDSEEKVEPWYRDYLLGHGWTIYGLEYVHMYRWVDKDGPTPWGLSLTVGTIELEVDETEVELQIYRWPNVDKLPLYPGAQQVEAKSVPPPKGDEGEMEVRVTTYVTEATPDEVERYYKPVLQEHTWQPDEKAQGSIDRAPGIVYHHWYGAMPSRDGANLYICAQPQGDGLTKVEMRVEEFHYGGAVYIP
jgi:hypothetical protein